MVILSCDLHAIRSRNGGRHPNFTQGRTHDVLRPWIAEVRGEPRYEKGNTTTTTTTNFHMNLVWQQLYFRLQNLLENSCQGSFNIGVTSHRRHYDVMCLLGICPPFPPPPPPNILNLPTPMFNKLTLLVLQNKECMQ